MGLSVRDWMVIVGVLLVVAVLLDGYRRMRHEWRNQIRMSLSRSSGDKDADPAGVNSELPNGGARVIPRREQRRQQRVEPRIGTGEPADASSAGGSPVAERILAAGLAKQPTAEPEQPPPESDPVTGMTGHQPDERGPTSDAGYRAANVADAEPDPWLAAPVRGTTGTVDASPGDSADEAADPVRRRRAGWAADAHQSDPAPADADPLLDRHQQTRRQPSPWQDPEQEPIGDHYAVGGADEPIAFTEHDSRAGAADSLNDTRSGKSWFAAPDESPAPAPADEVLVINVLARDRPFSGAELLQILLTCDLRFGKMNIFHRYEEAGGKGPLQFSVANIVEPGVFDLDRIDDFTTRGVCFFLTLPGPRQPLVAFNYMVETAQCLVRNLNGELRDEAHSVMTAQTLEHCRARIREFERRQLTLQHR